jgi:PAS domain S-box-containing protein
MAEALDREEMPLAPALLDQALKDMPLGVLIAEAPSGRLIFANEQVRQIWRHATVPAVAMDGYGEYKGFHADGRPYEPGEWPLARAILLGETIVDREIVFERGDGTRGVMSVSAAPIRDDEGQIIAGIVAFTDISRRKLAEQSASRLAAIVEWSDDAIIAKDLNGIIAAWNEGAERLFGYMAEEVIGKPVTILIPPDRHNEERVILDRIRRGERVDHYETVRRRKDGGVIEISLTVSPIKDAEGRIIGASKIGRDITERKRSEEKIKLLAREVNHRANNLLTLVNAMMRQTRADTVPAFVAAMQGRIAALARVQTRLARDQWEPTDLGCLIGEELEPFAESARARLRATGPLVPLGEAAAQALAIVVHELATNALKYGALSLPAGRVEVEWTQGSEGDLVLSWKETGGPPLSPPRHKGFGTTVISLLGHQLGADVQIEWRPEGFACRLTLPKDKLRR